MRPRRRPLRVVIVSRAVAPLHGFGGLERSVADLSRHLVRAGVHVTLVTPPPASPRQDDAGSAPLLEGIPLRHVPYLTFPGANRRGTTILDRGSAYLLFGHRAGRLAARLAADGGADVVHGFGASALGYVAPAARGGVPPLVLNPQGLEEFGASGALSVWKKLGYAPLRQAVRRVARAADAIIATDHALEPVVQRHLQPKPEQLWTIPNGLDVVRVQGLAGPADGARVRQSHGLAADATVFLSVGRLEFNKGFDVLAAALARMPAGTLQQASPWHWVIVGAGPYRRALERAVAAHGLEQNVLWAGRVPEAELHAWYEAASLFVHPTRYEGSSLVTLEAMAHGRPVVATRAGGLPDKVRPGINGWLADPGDPQALAVAIRGALAERAAWPARGAAGRDIVAREFAWPVLAERHVALYHALIDRRQAPEPGGAARTGGQR
jgi:glycosyltransferase involved in cell wall biosynthesis